MSAGGCNCSTISRRAEVLVCFADRSETRGFSPPADPVSATLITGMGSQRAAGALKHAFGHHSPRLVLSCGFAGGLNPDHPLGSVLFEPDAEQWNDPLRAAGAHPGRFIHSDRVLVTAAEKVALFRSTQGDAVEMESLALRKVCREYGVPCITVRVISDTAEEDLPLDFNRFTRADGSLSVPRLLAGLARQPGVVPELMRFNRRLGIAARALGEVLRNFLEAQR
jgi:adenosylhomocysteine nucleosidase